MHISQCHMTVRFPGRPLMHYRADAEAAHTLAKAAYERGPATIRIDQDIREELQPMPCQRLWR